MKTKRLCVAVGVLLVALGRASAQPAVIQFTSTAYSIGETDGMVSVTVELTDADPFSVYLVDYSTADGVAAAGADYLAQSGTLRFEFPETNKTLNVPILRDGRAEGNETFGVALSNLTCDNPSDCYAMLGTASNAVVTILDHERLVNVDPSFQPHVSGRIRAMVEQSDGRLVIAGDFSEVDEVPRNGLARLNTDGSLDASFDPGAGVEHDSRLGVHVFALQPDGKILIAGSFDAVNGIERTNLARLNADGSLDRTFEAASAAFQFSYSSGVLNLQPDGKALIAGYDDNKTNHVFLRLNGDGSVDSTFSPAVTHCDASSWNGIVGAVAIQSDARIIIGGYFRCVNGVSRTNIARLNPDGSLDDGFTANIGDAYVSRILLQPNGRLLLLDANGLHRLNADGSLDSSFRPAHFVYHLHAIQPDGKILVEVLAACPADKCYWLRERWNADGSVDSSFRAIYSSSPGPLLSQHEGSVLIADGYQWQTTGGFRYGPGPLRLFGQQTNRMAIEFEDPTISRPWSGGEMSVPEGYAARLIVKRYGDIRESVSVDYATVDGIAAAGADYLEMTGTLTFAAFEDEKVISIPTYDDNCAEGDETFSAALSNATGGMLLGYNRTQQVIVYDDSGFEFRFCSTIRLPNGQAQLTLNAIPGTRYILEVSTNLVDWVSLETRVASHWSLVFTDTNAPSFSRRFYRAVSP